MSEGVRKRGKTWSYYFDTAKINGERNKMEKGGFKTQKEAIAARATAMVEYNNTGRTFSPKEISIADYLDYWLEEIIHKQVDHGYSYNTYRGYETTIRIHLKPAFGVYKLSSFQYAPDVVQTWVNDMKIRGFSKHMISNTLSCLSGAIRYAITPLKYIQANPCASVCIGKIAENIDAKIHTEYVLSKDEFQKIIERFPKGNRFNAALVVPYYTGTRLGETFGIDLLHDIDFEKHQLIIRRQMMKIGSNFFSKAPKHDSYRNILIGETLENELKEIIKQRKINQLKYGGNYLKTYLGQDGAYMQVPSEITTILSEIMPLCVKDNGELLTTDSFKYCARVIHWELGNTLFHSHCLRHTHGTILAENGVNPKTVMERLGHKDISTTLQVYTFNTDVMQQTAVDVFEKAAN